MLCSKEAMASRHWPASCWTTPRALSALALPSWSSTSVKIDVLVRKCSAASRKLVS